MKRGLVYAGTVFAAGTVLLTGCAGTKAAPNPSVSASSTSQASPGGQGSPPDATALAALNTLTVKGRGPKTGYTRDQYGPSWSDVDHNGCDTRNDILARDLTNTTYKDGSKCVLASGSLNDPYTGVVIQWQRGQDTSSAVQIDHVVALSDAWQKGAAQWSAAKRLAFANDPVNLIAADGPANMAKGDGDAATWLPPNKGYWCGYVSNQVAVKQKYGVSITEAEKKAMANVLTLCPDAPLPTSSQQVPQ